MIIFANIWYYTNIWYLKVYVCEMEMDLQICLKRNIHNRTEDEINRIIDYFEPTPSYHQKLDVNSMLQEQAIEEVILFIFFFKKMNVYIFCDKEIDQSMSEHFS